MKKTLSFLLVLLIFAGSGFAQKVTLSSDLLSMVETEREFSRTSAAKGMRDAFLAFLADDGIVFRPGPVNGKKSWGERPPPKGLLTWEPVYADMSRAGDMGYTTGPWEFRQNGPDDKPAGYGQFVTVWQKQSDGKWRFVLDIGCDNPAPTAATPALQFPKDNKGNAKWKGNVATERALLLAIDGSFSRASLMQGTVNAFLAYAADDIRFFRNGMFPVLGKDAVRAALSAKNGTMTWKPMSSGVSRSGDLGYTYGSYEFKANAGDAKSDETGHYVRIWKKQATGGWKVVLDIINPSPPERQSA